MLSRKGVFVLAVLGCMLFCMSAGAVVSMDGKRTVTIPQVANGPVLDGVLGDPVWQNGAEMSGFTNVYDASKPVQQTRVRALYDSKYLYLGIKCDEDSMKTLVSKGRGYDSGVWNDDDVEIYLDATNARHTFCHLSRNPHGAYVDVQTLPGGASDGWDFHGITKTGSATNWWSIEIAIPFSDLGVTPTPGMVWGINVCRSRRAGAQEFSAWSPSPGTFEQPNRFGTAVFGDKTGNWNGIQLLSWGDVDPVNNLDSDNTLLCSIPNSTSQAATFTGTLQESSKGKLSSPVTSKIVVNPGATGLITIPYCASAPSIDGWSFSVESEGKQLFNATHNVLVTAVDQRVWAVNDPLYKELLSTTPPGLQQNGCIYWMHTYQPSLDQPFGKEYGIRYSSEESLKEFADAKLLGLVETWQLSSDKFLTQMADKYNFKILLYPDIMRWTAPDAPKVGSASFVLDPRSKKHYFDDLKYGITNWRKYIWGIYSGDEFSEYAMHQAVTLYIEHKNDYPFIREVNAQVKKEFGFGKYGMPESIDDNNPYRWIAARRWVNKQICDWQKDVYDTIRSMAPELKIISIDPVAGHKPVAFDQMSPYFDVATQQLYPPVNPNRQQFGFTTKMVTDLTGRPTWPCTHVENYAYSTTLDEVSELLSEVMRSGGKGFHYWLKDEHGNNAPNGFMMATKWGFPERWRALCELNTLNATMNEVAVPKDPDSAILYSEDYYQSFPEKVVRYPYIFSNEPEWAYTFFGPVARTWFKFVNDNMIAERKVDLSKFKVVTVPAAKYERRSVAEALVKYVKVGGTLIVGEPDSFVSDINGDSLADIKGKLIGSSAVAGKDQASMKFSAKCSLPRLRNRTLAITGIVSRLTPGANSEVMARFSDGSAAVLRNRVGKGSVIVFACNPFTESGIADKGWKSFFKALAQDLGLKTDRDIWRFKFPAYKTVAQSEPQGGCLTGNYLKWWQDKPMNIQNAAIAGTYTYSVVPDFVGEQGTATSVPFTTGKLTDRKKAFITLKDQLKPEDFVVSWKTEKPVDITFDLLTPRSVTRLNLWYSGQLPSIRVEGSVDGQTWTTLADSTKKPMMNPADDVLDIALSLANGSKARYVRLSLGDRDPGNPMTLVECEVWGDLVK